MTKKKVDELFFKFFCEKNSDGTRLLRLPGNELIHRIGRRLGKDDMAELVKFLRKNPEVISLNLAYNNITDEGLNILAQQFFDYENNLQYLNMLHCDIKAEGLNWLSSATHLNLKNIRLLGNHLGAEGARFIGKLIEHCPTLEGLDIGQTDQTLESIESLLIVIEKSRLKYLNISRIIPNSYYSQYNNTTLADNLGVLLRVNNTLQELQMQKSDFDGYDVELIVGGLQNHTNLYMLDLGANRIADHGARLLANWLRTRPSLLALRIPANEITNRGAHALGLSLPFSRLRILDVHNNVMGDQGISDILNSLKKSTQIRMLFIWGNILEARALRKIERALKSGVLDQDNIDVKLYSVDGQTYASFNPVNNFDNHVYCVSKYGVPQELKIVKRNIPEANAQPRALINLHFFPRLPPVNLKVPRFKDDENKDRGHCNQG